MYDLPTPPPPLKSLAPAEAAVAPQWKRVMVKAAQSLIEQRLAGATPSEKLRVPDGIRSEAATLFWAAVSAELKDTPYKIIVYRGTSLMLLVFREGS